MDSTINESQAECRRLKAEVERLGGNLMSEQEAGWKLIAEVERLTAYSNYLTIEANVDHARWLRTLEENDQLRAQVERLTKAGDAMAEAFELKYPVAGKLIIDWHAAKEGKQP